MRKTTALLVLLILWSAIGVSQQPRAGIEGPYLLKTAWGGSEPFNMFAPGQNTLGCHSNAFAQVLYFHRLEPHGAVSYTCSDGTRVAEDFSAYKPEWDLFALGPQSGTEDTAAIRRTAAFIYCVASIVRKDFGSDQYVDYQGDFHKQAIEAHFDCTLTSYVKETQAGVAQALGEQPDFRAILRSELDARRPVGFYYTDRKGGGHAVVIDGCALRNGQVFFHVNFGFQGRSNGWYLLEEDLPPNTREIALITIVPKSAETQEKASADEG